MLFKDCKISRGKDYSYIYKNGRRISGQYVIIFVKESRLNHNRFGIVTSKKIGNAVIRNRAKRQIREVIRKNLNKLRTAYDLVLVARFSIKETSSDMIEKDFLKLMRKASLL